MIKLAHCRTCNRNATPKTVQLAKPLQKCALCHSIDIREATKDEAENVVEVPKSDTGLKIFSV